MIARFHAFLAFSFGEVAEWSNVPDSKSGVPKGTGGSNPSLSAILRLALIIKCVDFISNISKGDVRGINELKFFDRFLLFAHSIKAAT